MNKKKIIVIILTLIGILLILYPFVANIINSLTQTTIISNYQEKVDSLTEEEKKEKIEEAQEYNQSLEKDIYIDISLDETEREQPPSYLNILNLMEEMGYIVIPKIKVNLPIYHGLSDDVLQNGVGHVESTSLPVGGKGTHSVLAGHTGLARMKIFDDINELEDGDVFYINILGTILKYKVDSKLIVEPSETESLKIEEGKDYITLVTCTPKYINSHRLLVRGERTDNISVIDIQDIEETQKATAIDNNAEKEQQDILKQELGNENKKMLRSQILKLALIILVILFIIILIIRYELKKKKEKKTE